MRTIRDIPSEVHLSVIDGVPRDCAINFDHMQTVSKDKIGSKITALPKKLRQTGNAINFALELT